MIASILTNWCPQAEIIGNADGVLTGFNAINQLKPDLVLLDIQMTDGTGFNLLNKFDTPNFNVIFITAHEEYAFQAIKASALDYILKPVDPEELINAVRKSRQRSNSK